MPAEPNQISNVDELRTYVHTTLCHENELEPSAFPVTQRILVRGKQPCGIFFCVHGPRSVKFTAIWETDRNTVLFYNSVGERVRKTHLVDAPSLAPVSAG